MNPHITEIAYILDRSGSMSGMEEAAVAAFNAFLKSQLDVPGDARLTLVLFDDQYEVPVAGLPVGQVPELTAATYTPRGGTALLDAIGRTIKENDARIRSLPDAEKPDKVILAIFTEGEENASIHYTMKHLSDLISLYRREKGWEFLFLAANQDAIATAAGLSIHAADTSNIQYTAVGVKSSGGAIGRKARAMRMASMSAPMTASAKADLEKPMSEIVSEETEAEAEADSASSTIDESGVTTE